MNKKALSVALAVLMLVAFQTPSVYAIGAKEAGASLLLPSTGQAMNGQLGNSKTKLMVGLEIGLITTIAVLGGVVGGGIVWAGLGPLIANHIWSAADAYKNAQYKTDPKYQQGQMVEAQRALEMSRQRRFDREQAVRSDIRERVMRAGELAY